jgi:uncharacterized coiled-coil protein SlyX
MKSITLKGIASSMALFFSLIISESLSQVAINNDGSAPDASAILDVKSSDKGLLIPRVALTGSADNTTVPGAAGGLLVINTATVSDVTPGLYIRQGSLWERMAIGGTTGEGWNTTGNTGTTISSNFIGTIDSVSLRFRVFGKPAGFIQRTDELIVGSNTFFGLEAGLNTVLVTGYANSFFGDDAGRTNTTGSYNSFLGSNAGFTNNGDGNSFFGYNSGYFTSSGDYNSFFGNNSGLGNSGGSYNVFVGDNSGSANISGSYNSFFGESTGRYTNSTGSGNTLLGSGADVNFEDLQNATAIGYKALVSQSNSLVLGGTTAVGGGTIETLVGIGTSTPDTKLEVNGSNGVAIRISSSGAGQNLEFLDENTGTDFRIKNNGTLTIQRSTDDFSSTTDLAEFTAGLFRPAADNTIGLGSASFRWTDVWSVNGTIQTSDARDKNELRLVTGALEKISALRPVYFSWKEQGIDQGREHIGLMAQELKQVIPQAVIDHEWAEEPETGMKKWVQTDRLGVNYVEIIPVLVSAIQEQQQMIEQLQDENRRILQELESMHGIPQKTENPSHNY